MVTDVLNLAGTTGESMRTCLPASGTKVVWQDGGFGRPSPCPKCRQPVFFVRHNGGGVWFDALGQPWPMHPCMASEPDMKWLKRNFPCHNAVVNRKVFGIIREARVVDPGIRAFFLILCSDGTVIADEFVYSLNLCEAVGGLVRLELTPDNRVGARRFKAIDDMLEAHKATVDAEERIKWSKEKRAFAIDSARIIRA